MDETCPYCNTPIPDHIGRLGGMCSHCFADIPGEDAATAPGGPLRRTGPWEAVKVRRDRLKAVAGVAGALLLSVGLAAAGWSRYSAPVEFAGLDLGEDVDDAFTVAFEVATDDASIEAEFDELTGWSDEVELPADLKTAGYAHGTTTPRSRPKPKVPVEPEKPKDLWSPDFGPGLDIDVTRRAAAPLSGSAIDRMVQRELRNYERADVRRCYEQALKGAGDLEGAWTVSFGIAPDGTTSDVRVRAHSTNDAGLEGCLSRAAKSRRFAPIDVAIDVEKRFALTPWE